MRSPEHVRMYVTPRSARDELIGVADGVVRVRVAAPPVEGRANAAVERLIARVLHVPPSNVAVVGGKSARQKLVVVHGWNSKQVLDALTVASLPGRSPAG